MKNILLLIASFTLLAFNSGSQKSLINKNSEPIQFLALGDSYTIGEAIAESGRWPNQLQQVLNAKGYSISQPQIIAKTGWRTDDLYQAIEAAKLKPKSFDLISLLIGVNNQYQGKSIKQFKEELNLLIEKAISLSKNGKAGVFIISIPDYSVTPFGQKKDPNKIAEELKAYNQICENTAIKYGIPFYYITDISQKAKFDSTLLAKDQLHPSAKMYKAWVRSFHQQLAKDCLNPQGHTVNH